MDVENTEQVAPERFVRVRLRAGPLVLKELNVHSLDDTPAISMPSTIRKPGLSQVVIHFLQESNTQSAFGPEFAFEFLDILRGVLVKSSIELHFKKYKLSEEDELLLEYDIPKYSPFQEQGSGVPVPDWISSLSVCSQTGTVLAGTFDGSLISSRSSNEGLQVSDTILQAHLTQLTSVSCFQLKNAGKKMYVASCSKDASICIRNINDAGKIDDVISTLVSGGSDIHSLETVCTALSSDEDDDVLLASAGSKGDVFLYHISDLSSASSAPAKKNNNKKIKESTRISHPTMTLRGHSDKVTSCKWSALVDPVTLFSGGWDHSLRVWDCVRQVETVAMHAQKPFSCLDYSSHRNILVSGHPDHVIRLWDARVSGDAIAQLSMKGHLGWVSSVAFVSLESDSPLIASASYDRTVRLWDLRGGVPVQTLQTDVTGRLFSVAFLNEETLVFGGSDSTIRTWSTK